MNKIKYIACCSLAMVAIACEQEYPDYETTQCNLNFAYYDYYGDPVTTDEVETEMCETSFSFVYGGEATVDTLWFDVATMGYLADGDRPIALQQIPVEGADNAEAGTHYVAFDDPSLSAFYKIPARANKASIPVVVLRNDATLKDRTVTLKFGFKENDYFKPGYDTLSVHTLYITDRLSQPSNWSSLAYFGAYGEQKHLLMIEWTGDAWDEEYIEELVSGDAAYWHYMANWMKRKLEEENAKRLADPAIGEVYKEADGKTVVEFPGY